MGYVICVNDTKLVVFLIHLVPTKCAYSELMNIVLNARDMGNIKIVCFHLI
jgi:hypothetical protein